MELTIRWRYIIGIDISKHTLDLHLLDRKTGFTDERQVANDNNGFERMAEWLDSHQADTSQTVLVSEHTGRYGEHLLRWTTDNRWSHAVENTTALDKVGYDHHRKGDSYDAKELADYGRRFSDRLRLTEAPAPAAGQITRLQAERRKMIDRRAALKTKRGEADTHDADMERLIEMWDQQVALLSEHIAEIEDRIDQLIAADPALANYYQILRTAPGMGNVLTPFWVGLFAGQSHLDPRKISSRFGFAPHSYDSGTSVHSPDRSTGYGNSEMRKLMHQAARSVANHKPHYHDYYERKLAEGKHELVAINNIINKLIRLYCAMWNNKEEYDPDYIQKNKHKWKKSA